jgi:UPF0271 protein
MEANINCDLGEDGPFGSIENDPVLLTIINTANVACGYHAGDENTIRQTIRISKKNKVSIGVHPSFKDRENFGRSRIQLSNKELYQLITEQLELFQKIADEENYPMTHVKPHGAMNNMACENYEIASSIGRAIKDYDSNLIYMVGAGTEMEKAGKDLNLKLACEIFADRNYDDHGYLISRKKPEALISDPALALKHSLMMLNEKAISCYSGKKIPCEIDTICLHSDGKTAIPLAKILSEGLRNNGIKLLPLDQLSKFSS